MPSEFPTAFFGEDVVSSPINNLDKIYYGFLKFAPIKHIQSINSYAITRSKFPETFFLNDVKIRKNKVIYKALAYAFYAARAEFAL